MEREFVNRAPMASLGKSKHLLPDKHTSISNFASVQLIHRFLETFLTELENFCSRLDTVSSREVQHIGVDMAGCNQRGLEVIALEEEWCRSMNC